MKNSKRILNKVLSTCTVIGIIATMGIMACSDDKDSGSNSGSKRDKVFGVPSESEMSDISAKVTAAMAESAAEPGSDEFCDAFADAIKEYDALNFGGAEFADAALQHQAMVYEHYLEACEGKSSFDWYREGKAEATISCDIPKGLDVKGLMNAFNEIYSKNPSTYTCETAIAAFNKVYSKYAGVVDFFNAFDCDDDTPECEAKTECLDEWSEKYASKISDQYAAEWMALEMQCFVEGVSMDPCDSAKCDLKNEICMDGECIDLCAYAACKSDQTCKAGICIGGETPVTPTKSCTEDASICTGNTECVNGTCKPKGGEVEGPACSDLPNTEKLVKDMVKEGAVMDCDTFATNYMTAVNTALSESKKVDPSMTEPFAEVLLKTCAIKWLTTEQIMSLEDFSDECMEEDDF